MTRLDEHFQTIQLLSYGTSALKLKFSSKITQTMNCPLFYILYFIILLKAFLIAFFLPLVKAITRQSTSAENERQ